jgi:elongation factor G
MPHNGASVAPSLDITPKTAADRQKVARALQVLAAEDDQLEVRRGAEPDCTVVGATSEAHLEQIVDRLKREFEVEASVGRPTVAYLETVTRSAEGTEKYVRIADGHGEYAHVSLRLRPAEAGAGYSFEDTTIGGTIPKRFMPSIEGGIRESMANGVLRGHPIVDVRVEVHDGSYHDTDSTDAAFRTAAALAFQDAARRPSRWCWSQSCRSS